MDPPPPGLPGTNHSNEAVAQAAAFGAFALPPARDALRRTVARVPVGPPGRWAASLARRILLAGTPDPFDVTIFGGVNVRVFPRTNRCEKRVLSGDQFFDPAERAALSAAIAVGERPFTFVDAGANVGLYTLHVANAGARAGRPVCAIAVEPDAQNRARLTCNLAANAFAATVVPAALTAHSGTIRLTPAGTNRGEIHAAADATGAEVAALSLADLWEHHHVAHVDAMKMDIEGSERAALTPFFSQVPSSRWPRLLIVETGRSDHQGLIPFLTDAGYQLTQRTRLNAILSRADEPEDV